MMPRAWNKRTLVSGKAAPVDIARRPRTLFSLQTDNRRAVAPRALGFGNEATLRPLLSKKSVWPFSTNTFSIQTGSGLWVMRPEGFGAAAMGLSDLVVSAKRNQVREKWGCASIFQGYGGPWAGWPPVGDRHGRQNGGRVCRVGVRFASTCWASGALLCFSNRQA